MKAILLLTMFFGCGAALAEFPPFLFSSSVRTIEAVYGGYVVTRTDGGTDRWHFSGKSLVSNDGVTFDQVDSGWSRRGGGLRYQRISIGWQEYRSSGDGRQFRMDFMRVVVGTNSFGVCGNRVDREK